LNDSIATPDGEREIHATGRPFQVTTGTKPVGCVESATADTCGYSGGAGLGGRCAIGCVVLGFTVPVWLRSELDDPVERDRVELDPVLVARVDPPPQPASASTTATALSARAGERLILRLA
jgi:hypothetical protein